MIASQIRWLLWKDFAVEWKQKFSFTGLLVYVAANVFICYLTFTNAIDIPTWNALFWIINSLIAMNAVAKSFMSESSGALLFQYVMYHPLAVIVSKIIFNTILLSVLSITTLILFDVMIGNNINNLSLFILCIITANFGMASILTLVSGIAAKAGSGSAMMAILALPLLFPLILVITHLSKNILDGVPDFVYQKQLYILISLDSLTFALSCLLFPFIWKD